MTSARPVERRAALADAGPVIRPLPLLMTGVAALLAAVGGLLVVDAGATVALTARTAVLVVVLLSIAGVLGTVLVAMRMPVDDPHRDRILDAGAAAATAWAIGAATTAFLLYLVDAPSPSSPAFGSGLVAFVAEVPAGRSWALGAAAAAVLSALLIGARSRAGVAMLAPATVAAVLPIALQVAPPGTPTADARVVAGVALVQVVALAAWLGAAAVTAAVPGVLSPASHRRPHLVAAGAAGLATACGAGVLASVDLLSGPAVVGGVVITVAAIVGLRSRLAGAVLLAVGLGLGSAASVTRSAPLVAARSAPAEILTGAPLPAPFSPAAAVGSWLPDPLWTVVAVALLVAYAVAAARLRGSWAATRTVSWVIGVLVLVVLTSGAFAVYAPLLFAVQLAQQVGLLLLVPALLAFGAPLELLQRVRPSLRADPLPVVPVAVVLVLVSGAVRSSPVLRWSVDDPVGTEVVAALMLLTGLLFASAMRTAPLRTAIVVAVVLLVLETAAAILLAVGPGLVLADWFGAMGWGTDALSAQQAAALPAWALAAVPTAALGIARLRASRASAVGAPA